jgi:hypothetical protein
MRTTGALGLLGVVLCAVLASGERDAKACGGCFHGSSPANPVIESSVVSDHRMVFALGPQQTVLWDQIRYTGDPSEFVWVLPVRPGTTVELSHDEWIASLDAVTQPRIIQPLAKPLGSFNGGYGGDENGGRGCGCSSTTTVADTSGVGRSSELAEAGVPAAPPPVQVIAQAVVGPYETVIVRSDKPKALETWLQDHGYAVPDSILPIIEAYTKEQLDFVALRLRPGQGVRAMQPVRIVSPGADPTLPLRMVAAGIGAKVGLTLYIVSEGRYRPQNFPEGQIDETKLVWNAQQARSNYQELSAAVMAGGGDRTWLTEFAGRPSVHEGDPSGPAGSLFDSYYGACSGRSRLVPTPTLDDAGNPDASDGGDPDASDGGDPDASGPDAALADDAASNTPFDAGPRPGVPESYCTSGLELCCDFDDLAVAVGALHRGDVWLTRLRADLPAAALAEDLRLEAHPQQVGVTNFHTALLPTTTAMGAQIAPAHSTRLGTGLVVLGSAFLVGRMVRRRRPTLRSDRGAAPTPKE